MLVLGYVREQQPHRQIDAVLPRESQNAPMMPLRNLSAAATPGPGGAPSPRLDAADLADRSRPARTPEQGDDRAGRLHAGDGRSLCAQGMLQLLLQLRDHAGMLR